MSRLDRRPIPWARDAPLMQPRRQSEIRGNDSEMKRAIVWCPARRCDLSVAMGVLYLGSGRGEWIQHRRQWTPAAWRA